MAQFIFEPTEKMILAFEWDLRDIDGATHFIQYKFVQFTVYTSKNDRTCSKLS